MNPQHLARLIAAGRASIGVLAVADPTRALEPWIGPEASRGPARLLGRAVGVRDLVIAAGALRSAGDVEALRPWLAAGILADCVDFTATAVADDIPWRGRAFVLGLAGGAVVAGAVAMAQLEQAPGA